MRRARLRSDAALELRRSVHFGRRLSPPHRVEYLGEQRRASPPPGTTGLFHTAILYPTRATLADALHRVIQAGIPLDGASDHGVSEALYLRDPDENGVELYWDRPKEQWPRKPDGTLAMFTRRLDLDDLLRQREA